MKNQELKITSIEDLIFLINDWYANDFEFKRSFDQTISGVQTIPNGTAQNVIHDWKGNTIDDLCVFFESWYAWNPQLKTGLEFIQKFSWLYYENPNGLEFVTTGKGLMMTKYFVEINARKMNSTASIPLVKQWEKAIGTQMDEYIIPENGYQSFNEFFSRELKIPREISDPNNNEVVVSPADAIINMIDDELSISETPISVKTQQLNVMELLDNSQYASNFEGGTAVSCILMPNVYHRYHSPVNGTVIESNSDVAGEYFGICDFPKLLDKGNVGYKYSYSVFEHFRRGYAIIETENYGLVGLVPVGLNTIASVVFNEPFQHITSSDFPISIEKGKEIGYFQYGGSMNILLFEKGVFPSDKFNPGKVTTVKQGQSLGKMKKK